MKMSCQYQYNSFEKTLNALTVLENQLKCSICGVIAQSPCILGGCEHVFCHVCVEKYLGASCPECFIPAHAKETDVNRQLFNIANLCQKLRVVLSDPRDDTELQSDAVQTDNHRLYTPKQPIKDVYDFETPTKETANETADVGTPTKETANETTAKNKTANKRTAGRKRNQKVETVSSSKINEKIARPELREQKTFSISKSRKAVPPDQSTMTQFYEYDDDDDKIGIESGLAVTVDDGIKRIQSDHDELQMEDGAKSIDTEAIEKHHVKKPKPDKKQKPEKKQRRNHKEKKLKAAEIITDICKATTRLRHKVVTSDDAEQANWVDEVANCDNNIKPICDSIKYDSKIDKGISNDEEQTISSESTNVGLRLRRRSINSNGQADALTDPSVEETQQSGKRSKVKKSKSMDGKLQSQESIIPKTALKVKDVEKSKCTTEEENLSTPKSTRRSISKVSSERKLSSEKRRPVQKTPKNALLQQRTKTNSTPGQRLSFSPGARLTPQRLKVNDSPAALSPVFNKRNAKGETPLQVAAIKNDEKKVAELLKAGANPNVRDNAGWTPLHEACNRGFTEVTRLLLDSGAMINVPGMDNDTPLHDAISNGRVECVKLLVSHGASLTTRNLQGFTAEDLAITDIMKKALKTTVVLDASTTEDQQPLDTLEYQQPCFMGTSLSRDQKIVLQKCASLLSAKLAEDCSPEVTHVISSINEKGMCARTIKYLQAVLAGKWILSMDWVNTCLEFGDKVCEEAFEVQGTSTNPNSQGPLKGRINRRHQLPGLFDGCQFYFHGNFEFSMPTKDDLVEVVKSGGGKILSREPKPGHLESLELTVPYHVDPKGNLANCCIFLVHENSAEFQPIKTKHMCSVTVSWIMDSVAEFKLKNI